MPSLSSKLANEAYARHRGLSGRVCDQSSLHSYVNVLDNMSSEQEKGTTDYFLGLENWQQGLVLQVESHPIPTPALEVPGKQSVSIFTDSIDSRADDEDGELMYPGCEHTSCAGICDTVAGFIARKLRYPTVQGMAIRE